MENQVRVQIYTMQSVDEALAVLACGADHVGVTPSGLGLPGEIDFETARAIVAAVQGRGVSVALSVESDIAAIQKMYEFVRPDILHLCGLEGRLPPDEIFKLKKKLPGVPIMQAISVADINAIQTAAAFQDVADYLILDTQSPAIAGIGASGETHDWNISRAIVKSVAKPVILAGGLSQENIVEAVNTVKPWGVDSLTHTNRQLGEGKFIKDLNRVRAFVRMAKLAPVE